MNGPEAGEAPSTRTHRDTFALVLVMGGMTTWAVAPAIALVHDNSTAEMESVLALALFIGCLVGAGVAASIFRGAALMTATVAGALTSALVIGCVHYIETRKLPPLDGFTASTVLLSIIATAAGATLGKRIAPRRGPGAAAIVMGALGATVALTALVDPSANSTLEHVLIALIFVSPLIGAAIGASLCGEVRPGSVCLWAFALFASTCAVIFLATRNEGDDGGRVLLGGLIISAFVAGLVGVPVLVVNRARNARAAARAVTVPIAHVVDR
jgi:hypothetical protein